MATFISVSLTSKHIDAISDKAKSLKTPGKQDDKLKIFPFSQDLYDFILSLEHVHSDKPKKKLSNHLIDASPEEVLKLGY